MIRLVDRGGCALNTLRTFSPISRHLRSRCSTSLPAGRCCWPAARQGEQAPRLRHLPVTVAQPTKRTVTDWDEFTGRFDAVEQVQIRARVTGFVNSVDFKDGAIVKTGDLLYVIDPRPYEAAAEQARGQLDDAKAKVELAQNVSSTARLTLIKTQAVSEAIVDQRRQALAGGAGRDSAGRRRAQARPARRRIHQGASRRSTGASAAIWSASAIWCRAARAVRRC